MLKNTLRLTSLLAALLPLAGCNPPPPSDNAAAPVAPAPAATPTATSAAVTKAAPAEAAPATKTMHWSAPPPMTIDPAKTYTALFTLQKGGQFTVRLCAKEAPVTVNSFVFLSRQGFFDGLSFHRVIGGFMAQGGDPTGTGMGGPGYQFKNENSDLRFDRAGVVAMANAGRNTNGSQFFITFGPAPDLDGDYTIFGQVTDGMDTVNGLTRRDPDAGGPAGDLIKTVKITEK